MEFDDEHGPIGVVRHGDSEPGELRSRLDAFVDGHPRCVLVLDIDGKLGPADGRTPVQDFMAARADLLRDRLVGVAVVMPSERARAAYQRMHEEADPPSPWPAIAVATTDDAMSWARARLGDATEQRSE